MTTRTIHINTNFLDETGSFVWRMLLDQTTTQQNPTNLRFIKPYTYMCVISSDVFHPSALRLAWRNLIWFPPDSLLRHEGSDEDYFNTLANAFRRWRDDMLLLAHPF